MSNLPLHDYQQVAKNFLVRTPKAGLFLDVGFGKTITALASLQELAELGMIGGHILVIAPKAIARSTWIDEMDKWGIKANIVSLIVDYDPVRYQNELAIWKEKKALYDKVLAIYPNPCDLKKNKGVIIDGVKYPPSKFLEPHATETEAYYKNPPRKPSRDRELSKDERIRLYEGISKQPPSFYFINKELITDLIEWNARHNKYWPFPTIVIDELQSFKSYDAKRFLMLKAVMPYVTRFIGLTGTPVPNGLMDLWPEIFLMDFGARLGKNITMYRDRFFNPGYTVNNVVVQWNPKYGAEEQIYDLIKDVVISIKNPNLNLPPVTYNNVACYMSDDEMQTYKKLLKENVLETQDNAGNDITIAAENSAILSAKLSQMASGALYISKDSKEYITIHKNKLEQMQYIIDNTTSPVLIAYHFKSDLDMISQHLLNGKYDFKKFDGSPEMIHEWNEGKIPIMLLQPASAGHGINIQDGGHTLIWYTLPWSLEHYIQTNGRLARQGQKNPVVIHHLLTHGTIDYRILKAIQNKDLSEQALIDAVAAAIDDADDEL